MEECFADLEECFEKCTNPVDKVVILRNQQVALEQISRDSTESAKRLVTEDINEKLLEKTGGRDNLINSSILYHAKEVTKLLKMHRKRFPDVSKCKFSLTCDEFFPVELELLCKGTYQDCKNEEVTEDDLRELKMALRHCKGKGHRSNPCSQESAVSVSSIESTTDESDQQGGSGSAAILSKSNLFTRPNADSRAGLMSSSINNHRADSVRSIESTTGNESGQQGDSGSAGGFSKSNFFTRPNAETKAGSMSSSDNNQPRNNSFYTKEKQGADCPPKDGDQLSLGFRNARDVLTVRNLQKYGSASRAPAAGTSSTSSNQQQPLFGYGAVKKSLGGRRTIRTGLQASKPKECPVETEAEPVDERLRNIDPKMIDSITNEIMHKFKPIDWNDIAGLEYAKSTIKEAVVWPLLRPDIFTGLRRPPRGILLFGPPGTGKTLIGKCIASQSKSTFFSISASSLTSKWIGDGEKMVRALFAVAAVNQPSVVFIDEIDSLLSQRSETEHESSRRIKTEFLVQLDGAATSEDERILIVGATNRPQELDEAARRRLVRRLYIPLPELAARIQILENLLQTVRNNLSEEQVQKVGSLTEGYSGADMETLCREASMEPIRSIPADQIPFFSEDKVRPVKFDDFVSALTRVRASVSQSDLRQYEEWNRIYGAGSM